MFRERRRNFRVQWSSPASVQIGDGRERINCTVINFSNGGARIVSAEPLPDEFMLRLTPGNCRLRASRVVWRRGQEIGVQFTDLSPSTGAPMATPTEEAII